jgi:hypothetical protein
VVSAIAEPSVKYHSCAIWVLTRLRESGAKTVVIGQFDWGGLLQKSNGGVQRYPQPGWQSGKERKRIRVLDCEGDSPSRDESRS